MWERIDNWLYQNAMAIFISAVASLLIFLNLPICKKVKDIIDEASVNEYVKSKKAIKV